MRNLLVLLVAALWTSAAACATDTTPPGSNDVGVDARLADSSVDAARFSDANADTSSGFIDMGVQRDANVSANDASTACTATSCTGGTQCCPSTGSCYNPACLACCMASRPDTGIRFPDTGITFPDAGTSCLTTGCTLGQSCCAFTGVCHPSGCLACCMASLPDTGIRLLDTGIRLPDTGTTCVATGCFSGLTCCASTGSCYSPLCLACCPAGP